MYQILNVITEAPTQALISLDELKMSLRIPQTDKSKYAELVLIIGGTSLQIAKMCNRVFGFEKVRETFYNVVGKERLFFSRWPVDPKDIDTLTAGGENIKTSMDQGTGEWIL